MSKIDVAAERKSQIVRATVECISKFGYHNFSMQDVARTAGVSKGIIHYYFLNKDELMRFVLEKVSGDIERVLIADMESIKSPVEKLEAFVNILFDVVRSTREYYQVSMDFWTQINQKEEVKRIISKHYEIFREVGASAIREGIAQGAFKEVDPVEYASYVLAVIDGLSLQWLFDDSAFDYDNMVKTAVNELVTGIKSK